MSKKTQDRPISTAKSALRTLAYKDRKTADPTAFDVRPWREIAFGAVLALSAKHSTPRTALFQPDDVAAAVDRYVGGRIRMRRKLLNLSQDGLAAEAGLSFSALDGCERGLSRLSPEQISALAKALGVPVAYFFEQFDPSEDDATRLGAALEEMQAVDEGQALAARFPELSRELRSRLLELAKVLADGSEKPQG